MLRRKEQQFINAKLIVEGFFISTLLDVFVASLCVVLGVALTSLFFSLFYTFLIFVLVSLLYLLKLAKINITRFDMLLLAVFALIYFALIVLFLSLPRYFTPDETTYIFCARKILLDGQALPMSISPSRDTISALITGRYVWTYLVAVFLGSTGVQPYYANLIGPAFLSMTGLASTELISERIKKNKELRLVTLLIVATNPLLVLFSGFALNDLAIAFYVLFALIFFSKSFEKIDKKVTINFGNLITSVTAIAIICIIKNNIVILFGMWLVLFYVILRYKLYKINIYYKILSFLIIIVPLAYEIVLDVPYVVATWFLRNSFITNVTRQFLVVSPAEMFLKLFMSPWWDPASKTIFTFSSVEYLDNLYTLLSPETWGVLISSTLLLLPLFLKRLRNAFQLKVVAYVMLISVPLFYLFALSNGDLGSLPRFSLWIIPIIIPISLFVFEALFSERCYLELFCVVVVTILLLWINWVLIGAQGGILMGYGSRYESTYEILLASLIPFVILIAILHQKSSVLLKIKSVFSKKVIRVFTIDFAHLSSKIFLAFVIIIFVSNVFVSSYLIQNSVSFKDHSLAEVSSTLEKNSQKNTLIIANNFIQMRPFISDSLFKSGLFLPPPDSETELLDLLNTSPNNTQIIVSNDAYVSSYEYANAYIKEFANSAVIVANGTDYATKDYQISSIFGNTTIFGLKSEKKFNQDSDIDVKSVDITDGANNSLVYTIKASSSKPENVSVLIGTDAFTKVYPVLLNSGKSDIKLTFEYQSPGGGKYWNHLGEARVIILDSSGKVIYNEYISKLDFRFVNFLFVVVMVALLCVLFVSLKRS
jgi:hypothetical protein